ncbi:MAG: phosphoglucomutase/phosphomannomutase family protein [Deltaproteobacteria bacterium]|nr:phosphoglucomutase/phosphomannomutase family protein [Deltaproteobacteria bacterium]
MTKIKFGTSGWRGIIADDFTFANARLVCQGIADYLKTEGLTSRGLVIGYDTRFLSEEFAAAAAEVLAGNGISCFLGRHPIPTPVVTFAILQGQRDGGLTITASHNPGTYNGIKFAPHWGGPAPTPITNAIEEKIRSLTPEKVRRLPLDQARQSYLVTEIDPLEDYLQDLATKVDVSLIHQAGLKIVVDPLYGTAVGYLDRFLAEAGVEVETVHNWRDPYFGGSRPEPSGEFLSHLGQRVTATGAHLGLAVDADADRFGVVDSLGRHHEANLILSLLLDYLVETRGWKQGVARSVATTHLIDRVAAYHGLPVYETKVGFKYLGDYIVKNLVAMVGEEADGFTMRGHLPEKDGILACILVAEMVARKKKDIPELRDELFAKVGPVYTRRLNLTLAPEAKADLWARLKKPPQTLAGQPVSQHVTLDGHKYILADGSWLCLRPSGTEPVVRLYLEADSPEGLEKLRLAAEAFLKGT